VRFGRLAARTDLERPWLTPGAEVLDGQAWETWIRRNLRVKAGRACCHLACEGGWAAETATPAYCESNLTWSFCVFPTAEADGAGRRPADRIVYCEDGKRRGLLAMERDCQAGNDEGQEKDRQDALSAASVGDDLTLGGVERLGSAGVSAVADLQGVPPGFDRYVDGLVQLHGPGMLAVDYGVVRTAADFHSNGFVRQLQHCGHRLSPLVLDGVSLSAQ
jgi:hypothetical protein